MAKELIKKPTFRSKAEMYRKSKWTKFKEWWIMTFSNIKREIAKILYKIHQKGSQKLTLMIVPHSEKRIINIQISNYIMFVFSVTLIITVITSVIAISNNQQTKKELTFLQTQSEYTKALIQEYKKSIESVSKRFTMFKADINNIIKSAGKEEEIYTTKEISLAEEYSNRNLPKEITELEKLKKELEITKDNIYRMGLFISSYKRLLKEIPSIYPLPQRGHISSIFGYRRDPVYTWQREFHTGVDIVVVPGTPILATADGVVKTAGWSSGYGWMVEIEHKYGFSTRYAHLLGFNTGIYTGAFVKQGQVIGYVGSTGKSTGYHLHYEVRVGGQPIDPLPFTSMLQ
jgi:murein DD-endopeptidase MepM/ murein hydrolase activator NlpD